jgi:acetolactate decarboxylase
LADGRADGGHLLDCREAGGLRVQLRELDDVRVAMPETAAFLQADLSRDPTKDLDVAEREGHRSVQAKEAQVQRKSPTGQRAS